MINQGIDAAAWTGIHNWIVYVASRQRLLSFSVSLTDAASHRTREALARTQAIILHAGYIVIIPLSRAWGPAEKKLKPNTVRKRGIKNPSKLPLVL